MANLIETTTAEDWAKIRKIAEGHLKSTVWVVPTWAYLIGLAVGVAMVFIDNNRSNFWIIVVAVCAAKAYARQVEITAYVTGWQAGEQYVLGDETIDDLLKTYEKH